MPQRHTYRRSNFPSDRGLHDLFSTSPIFFSRRMSISAVPVRRDSREDANGGLARRRNTMKYMLIMRDTQEAVEA